VVERHGDEPPRGRIVLGDNLAVLAAWCAGRAAALDLLYMDPPFMTGGRFDAVRRVGEGAQAPSVKVPGYDDRWSSRGAFIAMLDDRVRLSRELLADHGSLYVHLDPTMSHAAKLLLDEVFGEDNFQREIIWRIGWVSGFKSRVRNWVRNHDVLLFYAKEASQLAFTRQFVPHLPGYQRRSGKPSPNPGIPVDDVWNASPGEAVLKGAASLDSIQIKSFSHEKTGWATQKNESLVERLVLASSAEDGWVADPFMGSGTTVAVAARLGRRFLGCDRSPLALQLARQRLLALGVPFEVAIAQGADPPATSGGELNSLGRVLRCTHGPAQGWEIALRASPNLSRPPGTSADEGGVDAGAPCVEIEAWCVLDGARRVRWDCTRALRDDRRLEMRAVVGEIVPKFVRIYGVMGDVVEVALEEGEAPGERRVSSYEYLHATSDSSR
ncbi:MAG: DNA methyltransferase, partial [Nannocystaceae bacterium]